MGGVWCHGAFEEFERKNTSKLCQDISSPILCPPSMTACFIYQNQEEPVRFVHVDVIKILCSCVNHRKVVHKLLHRETQYVFLPEYCIHWSQRVP